MTPSKTLLKQITSAVSAALEEDVRDGDVTATLIDPNISSEARVICRDKAVLCGQVWFDETFRQCDPHCEISWSLNDGDFMQPDQQVCTISGNARAMVTAERTALNFLQTLSGTATTTSEHVAQISATHCKLLDTRKTIPLLRDAQKYAVLCGGGVNHRTGLYDGILIKENHIEAAGSITKAIQRMKKSRPDMQVETEVENIEQLTDAIAAGADILLLDNFSIKNIQTAVGIADGQVKLEASGGYEFKDLAAVAATGVDFISVGALTKHVKATDFSMRFTTSFANT